MRRHLEKLTANIREATARTEAVGETMQQVAARKKERKDPSTSAERRAVLDAEIEQLRERWRAEVAAQRAASDKLDADIPEWMKR
jgi:hypothetical protein